MTVQIQVGPNGFDAAKYVLNQVEDVAQDYITDDALRIYAEVANEDFSRHIPLDYVVGNVTSNTSPLTTVAMQTRYLCSPANGFIATPIEITDVLYLSSGGFTAADEASYVYLMPFSPVNRFLLNPYILDSPSQRIIRDAWLNELAHYGQGNAGISRDAATGLLAIDVYPYPMESGTPLFVRYAAQHVLATDANLNITVPTIPAHHARNWARLLHLEVLEQEGDRLLRQHMLKAGITTIQRDSKTAEERIGRMRDEIYFTLGQHVGTATVSH